MTHVSSNQDEPTPTYDLKGKKVVVVGGKVGIGLGVARAARSAGAVVTVASRRSVLATERPDLTEFHQVRVDVRDEAAVRTAFEAIGAFDHLVITAGPELGSWGSFMDEDMRGVRSYLEGKFLGSWACARYATPYLPPRGSITFLTGGTAAKPKHGLTAVMSTLAAVEAMSRSLALELGPIRVNTVAPGYVDTGLWDIMPKAERDALREKVRANFPARHAGTIGDIGRAAVFLMTNPYVTGSLLEVSGGELLADWLF